MLTIGPGPREGEDDGRISGQGQAKYSNAPRDEISRSGNPLTSINLQKSNIVNINLLKFTKQSALNRVQHLYLGATLILGCNSCSRMLLVSSVFLAPRTWKLGTFQILYLQARARRGFFYPETPPQIVYERPHSRRGFFCIHKTN